MDFTVSVYYIRKQGGLGSLKNKKGRREEDREGNPRILFTRWYRKIKVMWEGSGTGAWYIFAPVVLGSVGKGGKKGVVTIKGKGGRVRKEVQECEKTGGGGGALIAIFTQEKKGEN